MDLVDRIETTRFLGNEFLTFLWFKVELYEGAFDVGELGRCELWFDTSLQMAGWADESEKITLRGAAPSSSAEASEGLKQGKVPTKAALRLVLNSEEYVFTLNGKTLGLSGVKIPEVGLEQLDERFYERMRLLEQLDEVVTTLYDEFLLVRLSALWDAELVPALRDWVKGKDTMTTRQYSGLVQRALSQRKK
jgi:hypothetical protein